MTATLQPPPQPRAPLERAPRVALVAGAFDPDRCGVSHYTLRLGEKLREHGVEPVVIADRTMDRERRPSRDPLPWVEAVDDWSIQELGAFVRALRGIRADVLHLQFAPMSYRRGRTSLRLLPAILRAHGWPGRLVVTLHEYSAPPERANPVDRLVAAARRRAGWDHDTGLLVASADAILTTNDRHRGELLRALPAAESRVRVVPLAPNLPVAPVPSEERAGALRRRIGLPAGAPFVVFFGFIHPVKGIEYLVRAMRVLDADRRAVHLVVAGGMESLALDGNEAASYADSLRRLVESLDLSSVVHFTGRLPDETASELLSIATAGAVPLTYGASLKSGSLLAMLAHGLPVVTTRGPGPAPALVDGENVLLVQPRNPASLAEALERLLGDPALRERLGDAGRRIAAGRSWDPIARLHADLYRGLAAASRQPPERRRTALNGANRRKPAR